MIMRLWQYRTTFYWFFTAEYLFSFLVSLWARSAVFTMIGILGMTACTILAIDSKREQ